MKTTFFAVVASVGMLAGCAATKPAGAGPLGDISGRTTGRLQEMHEGLAAKTRNYTPTTTKEKVTNKRKLGTFNDELMQWDLRALAQVEEELIKRWKDGDAKAHFEGIEQKAGLAPAAAENPPAPAGPDNPQP
jgi:hypothetical protein